MTLKSVVFREIARLSGVRQGLHAQDRAALPNLSSACQKALSLLEIPGRRTDTRLYDDYFRSRKNLGVGKMPYRAFLRRSKTNSSRQAVRHVQTEDYLEASELTGTWMEGNRFRWFE